MGGRSTGMLSIVFAMPSPGLPWRTTNGPGISIDGGALLTLTPPGEEDMGERLTRRDNGMLCSLSLSTPLLELEAKESLMGDSNCIVRMKMIGRHFLLLLLRLR